MKKTAALVSNELFDSADQQKIYSSRSPLRYPGGKTRGVNYIAQFFPKNITEFVSPFFGGGSVELYFAATGLKVKGYDAFTPLVEFWQCLTEEPHNLAEKVASHYPLPKEKFYQLQQNQTSFETKIERAAVFYVLNRSSFSGSTLSGGMSPNHPRFTLSSIDRVREFFNPNIQVSQADFSLSLALHQQLFAYLDPPYLIKSSLYGKKGNTHKNFDHEGLAKILRERDQWILSYNDCEQIRTLYEGFPILTPNWKYGMSSNKESKEVLVFSKDLNPGDHLS
ncbi:MAG TPA: DNA adenine methylase [Flavipsychrobacter sp.]|nr:DNA adenine methylase [Flavipsychrobacter sp.]